VWRPLRSAGANLWGLPRHSTSIPGRICALAAKPARPRPATITWCQPCPMLREYGPREIQIAEQPAARVLSLRAVPRALAPAAGEGGQRPNTSKANLGLTHKADDTSSTRRPVLGNVAAQVHCPQSSVALRLRTRQTLGTTSTRSPRSLSSSSAIASTSFPSYRRSDE
jgi:hypothetical protein